MANKFFTYFKGRWVQLASLPLGTDNLEVVLFQATSLAADATMVNYQTLAAITAGGSLEATFTNYSRHILTSSDIIISVNTGTGVVTLDLNDQAWAGAGGPTNNNLGALIVLYRPTSTSTDAQILPLTKHDFVQTVAGGTLTAAIPSIGTAT